MSVDFLRFIFVSCFQENLNFSNNCCYNNYYIEAEKKNDAPIV